MDALKFFYFQNIFSSLISIKYVPIKAELVSADLWRCLHMAHLSTWWRHYPGVALIKSGPWEGSSLKRSGRDLHINSIWLLLQPLRFPPVPHSTFGSAALSSVSFHSSSDNCCFSRSSQAAVGIFHVGISYRQEMTADFVSLRRYYSPPLPRTAVCPARLFWQTDLSSPPD